MIKQIKIAFLLLMSFTIITGLIYPLVVTGLAQLFFPWQANGSLIEQNGKVIGSVLIGQSFADARFFWSRPSATTPYPYNGASSSGSNMGPTNPDFLAMIKQRVDMIRRSDVTNTMLIPVDLVTASGSGLDPEMSPAAAYFQAARIARARNMPVAAIQAMITKHIQGRTFMLLGEPRVNVLQLNMALASGS